jgi:hypothetical protein
LSQIETKQEIVKNPADAVDYWLKELAAADKHERNWRERSKKIIERYRDERKESEKNDSRYNILYANTEVLKGVMYQRTPVPDVRRRFLDKDPVAREAAKVLERCLSFSIDSYDFDHVVSDIVQDVLLPGRGVARVKYKPTIHTTERPAVDPLGQPQVDEMGQPVMEQIPEVVYQEVQAEYVDWEFFRHSPARQWNKVRWVAFGELLTREDLVAQFGELGQKCELNWKPSGLSKDEENHEVYKRALVWVIWDKKDRKVVVVCEGMKDSVLAEQPDPLGLEGFFPTPEPVYSMRTTTSLVPVPEYTQYQDQAEELNRITERIDHLIEGLKRRGIYDGTFTELERLRHAGDNDFIPVKDFAQYMEKGGLEKIFLELPIEGIANVLQGLYEQREALKQEIYEINGISDIVRGASKASETLGAQELKSTYANIRITPRQGAVARYVRDLLRLKAEVISEHFQPEILSQITGIQLPTAEEKQMAMQAMQMSQLTGMPPDPALQQKLDMPSWDEVMSILKSDKLRGFKVDIETDSTVKPNAEEEQRNRTEFLVAVMGFLEKALPAVQSGLVPLPVASELLMFGVRAFKVGPQLEEVLNQWAGGQLPTAQPPMPGQPPPMSPEEQAMQGLAVKEKEAHVKKAEASARNEEQRGQLAMQKAMQPPPMQ